MEGQGMEQAAQPAASKGRRIAFSVVSVVLGLLQGFLLFSLIALVLSWFQGGADQIHRIHNLAYGITGGLFIAIPFFVQAYKPEKKIALLQQFAAVIVSYLIAIVIAADFVYFIFMGIFILAFVILLVLHPARSRFLKWDKNYSEVLCVLVLVEAVPWIWAAITWAGFQRNGVPADPHVEMHHWTGMAALGVSMVLVAALAATRTEGWRIVAWLVGLGSIVYGAASTIFAKFPGSDVPYPGGEGVLWGSLAIVWGVVFIAVAEWQKNKSRIG